MYCEILFTFDCCAQKDVQLLKRFGGNCDLINISLADSNITSSSC